MVQPCWFARNAGWLKEIDMKRRGKARLGFFLIYTYKKNVIGKLFSIIFLVGICIGNTFAAEGYTLPDYHRILTNGKAVDMNLGIFPDGTLYLKIRDIEYPITDIKAFQRGTALALEDTQALQETRGDRRNTVASESKVLPDQLFSSEQESEGNREIFFTLTFERQENRYPIKITFHRGQLEPESFDFPPGELQYLRNRINIICENRAEYLARAKAAASTGL